jgi:uncharacterized spore protein YtfJ
LVVRASARQKSLKRSLRTYFHEEGKMADDVVNRLFDLFEAKKDAASWRAVFGEPLTQGDTTIIPVASVSYGMGLGVGYSDMEQDEAEEDPRQGGGGGGIGGFSKPVAVIVVTPERTTIRPVLDRSKVIMAGMFTAAWIVLCWTNVIKKMIQLRQSQQG